MPYKLKSLLKKPASWGQRLTITNSHIQWPENVLGCLENKFHLLPKDMAHLQCIRDRRAHNGIPMSFIRIFNRMETYEQSVSIKQYHDLDEHPELVLFEGHILKNGAVYLKKKENMTAA